MRLLKTIIESHRFPLIAIVVVVVTATIIGRLNTLQRLIPSNVTSPTTVPTVIEFPSPTGVRKKNIPPQSQHPTATPTSAQTTPSDSQPSSTSTPKPTTKPAATHTPSPAPTSEAVYAPTATPAPSVSVNTTSVSVTLSRAQQIGGFIYGPGFTLTNGTSEVISFCLIDNQVSQGEGFRQSSGGLGPNSSTNIQTYINTNKSNGVYTGSSTVKYGSNCSSTSGTVVATVSYSITLTD